MQFTAANIPGVFIIDLDLREDPRGFFARTFCVQEFEAHGLDARLVQANLSYTQQRGTLRGIHYQRAPATEAKLVRCTAGAICDVVVDLRPDSPTYLRHLALELSASNRRAVYIPAWCGHGYQTLVDASEVQYGVSEYYTPDLEAGIRYDDPALGIDWPIAVTAISDKDQSWPLIDSMWVP